VIEESDWSPLHSTVCKPCHPQLKLAEVLAGFILTNVLNHHICFTWQSFLPSSPSCPLPKHLPFLLSPLPPPLPPPTTAPPQALRNEGHGGGETSAILAGLKVQSEYVLARHCALHENASFRHTPPGWSLWSLILRETAHNKFQILCPPKKSLMQHALCQA
jgi:hypothetical protein